MRTPALLLWLSSTALAQTRELDPALVASATTATEDGPGSLWVQPANLAYDADVRWGLFTTTTLDPEDRPLSIGATVGVAGVGAGLRWFRRADQSNDFALDLAAGLRLPRRVAVGVGLHVNLEAQRRDHVAFDASASWRPLPWFGMSLFSKNIGGPGLSAGTPPETGGGVALRPIGRNLVLGGDFRYTFGGEEAGPSGVFSARFRPIEGLYVRAGIDTRLTFGAGVEVYFGGGGFGAHAGADPAQRPTLTAWVGSDEPGENVVPGQRQVPVLSLLHTPAYEPERTLLVRSEPSWLEILQQLDRAATSPEVAGLLLRLGDLDVDWGRWEELRARLVALQATDRPVLVHLAGDASTGAMYAASAADRVLMHPAGNLMLGPPSEQRLWFGSLLESVGVHVDVARREAYKSAADALTRDGPSAADTEQTAARLSSLSAELVRALSEGRGRTSEQARSWLDHGAISAEEAVVQGLVDGLAWSDELDEELTSLHGRRVRPVDIARQPRGRSPWEPPAQIGVVYVLGPLVSGESSARTSVGGRTTGAQSLTSVLERAALDPKLRAIVLRVDSPGGSVLAAEEIGRAIEALRQAGKPVVVSMGDLATSGAYYISADADAVWAQPDTITGSIGVITVHPSVGGLLDRLGVRLTSDPPGSAAPLDSPWARWDPLQRGQAQALVDEAYRSFKDHVARSRDLDPDRVEEIARGRVWTGTEARDLGLVDQLGGLVEAVADARRRAGIPERRAVEVVAIRPRPRLTDVLLPELSRLRLQAGGAYGSLPDLLSGTPVQPLIAWLTLLQQNPESTWMIEPSRIGPAPR